MCRVGFEITKTCPNDYNHDDETFCLGKCTPICDSDECAMNNICPQNSKCINKCNGFKCVCSKGFIRKDGKCVSKACQKDRCKKVECPLNSNCMDNCLIARCECNKGYTMQQYMCVKNTYYRQYTSKGLLTKNNYF